MDINKVYIGKIYIVTNSEIKNKKLIINLKFKKHSIFYKKDNLYYDLINLKFYKSNNNLKQGEEFVDSKNGLVPIKKYLELKNIKHQKYVSKKKIIKLIKKTNNMI